MQNYFHNENAPTYRYDVSVQRKKAGIFSLNLLNQKSD